MGTKRSRERRHKRRKEQLRLAKLHAEPEQGDHQETRDASENEQEEFTDMGKLASIYNKLFDGKAAAWTAIFTCVLAVFSWLLLEANNQANNTSIATQRAFITFSGPYLEKVVENNIVTGYRIHMPISNGGSTATKRSEYELAIAQEDYLPDEGTNFDALPQSQRRQYVFGPRQAYDPEGTFISLSDFEALSQSGKHTFIWGWVEYRDIFSDTPVHLSEYCLILTNPQFFSLNSPKPPSSHSDPTTEAKMTNMPCETHYCYDKECTDYSKRTGDLK